MQDTGRFSFFTRDYNPASPDKTHSAFPCKMIKFTRLCIEIKSDKKYEYPAVC